MFTAPRALVVALVIATPVLTFATRASAQSASREPDAAGPPRISWRVASGYGSFALRDIARTVRPVDASPIAWQGHGLAIEAQYTRERASQLHRFELAGVFARDFSYRSELLSVGRPSDDRHATVEGRYEYRRYPFRNVLLRGLDVGIGVQGLAARSRVSRHSADDILATETALGMGTAAVAAARWRRWPRVTGEIWWANGGVINRLNERHSESEMVRSHWGGGWLTHFASSLDIQVTRQAWLTVRYFRSDDGLLSSHRSAALSRRSIAAGVTYAK